MNDPSIYNDPIARFDASLDAPPRRRSGSVRTGFLDLIAAVGRAPDRPTANANAGVRSGPVWMIEGAIRSSRDRNMNPITAIAATSTTPAAIIRQERTRLDPAKTRSARSGRSFRHVRSQSLRRRILCGLAWIRGHPYGLADATR